MNMARHYPPNPIEIIYEDDDLLVVNKPAGLLTSTTPREKRPTLLKMVEGYMERTDPRRRIGLIHRLDRDASGLLVFAKTEPAYDSLKTQFYRHKVERAYLAVVEGKPNPPAGRIDTYLMELPDGRVVRVRQRGKGQHAITDYQTIESKGDRSLVEVTLHTGRKHQIRSHLSQRNCPIVGDEMYGSRHDDEPLHLCAVRLGFTHPRTRERVVWEIDPPFEWTGKSQQKS